LNFPALAAGLSSVQPIKALFMSVPTANFLEEPLLTAASASEVKSRYSLPGSFAALVRGEIAAFSSLRSHQRHVWHAFIVQLAALALEKAKQSRLPDDEATWRRMLRGLTLMWPDGEPWSLVVPDTSKPALLQAPIPDKALPQFRIIETPDALDMLVTSKNHDLKAARMFNAAPEDWLFALVSLQTQQGVMGAGKYGVSRMNGGYGSRPVVGVDSPGDAGSRFRRDVMTVHSASEDKVNPHGLSRDGIALVWLKPWNGSTAIGFRDLHPLYIEICRRVRLGVSDGKIFAMDPASSAARISGAELLKGNTGDPWTPVSAEGKAFTVGSDGFSSRRLAEVLNPAKYRLPVSVQFSDADCARGVSLVAQSVCRGQGKTQGFHERRVFVPAEAAGCFVRSRKDFTGILERRAAALSELRLAFRLGLLVLCQRGESDSSAGKEAARRFIEPALERFETETDRDFFEGLWEEMSAGEAGCTPVYKRWLRTQVARAQHFLDEAPQVLPHPSARRYWSRAQSHRAFRAVLAKSPSFQPILRIAKIEEGASAIG
jgi:CRISPR system Cascade subunit CasA